MPFVLANIFQPIIDVFEQVLLFFHDTVGFGWGASIIAMTIVVRTLMLPLTIKQFRSMQGLQQLAPQIKAIQEKYKDDKQRQNQEMMKFYQENKVNPFGSCLPLVLQIPVFISLFYMLRKDLKVDICGPESQILAVGKQQGTDLANTYCDQVVPGSAQFLFIPDLTAPGDRLGPGRAARPVRRLAAALERADVRDRGQDAALHHARRCRSSSSSSS